MANANILANISQISLMGSDALRSFCIAVRATSLVILLMLSLVFMSGLFATHPVVAPIGNLP